MRKVFGCVNFARPMMRVYSPPFEHYVARVENWRQRSCDSVYEVGSPRTAQFNTVAPTAIIGFNVRV